MTNLLNRRLLRDEMTDWDLRDTKTKLMMGTEECVMTCSPPDIREDKPGVQTAQFVHRTSHHSPRPLLLRCLELRYKHSPASDLITIPWCPSSVMVVSKVSFIKDYILKIDIWKFYILRHCWVSGWQRPCPGPSLRLSPSWIAHPHQEQSFLHHPLIFKP